MDQPSPAGEGPSRAAPSPERPDPQQFELPDAVSPPPGPAAQSFELDGGVSPPPGPAASRQRFSEASAVGEAAPDRPAAEPAATADLDWGPAARGGAAR
ncbi:MAG: hypothetical protein LBD90_02000, partial [Bifidobacteriaceae bacterium]|nr:hypothetical protein [Bifidobacteriaceae bacterium]